MNILVLGGTRFMGVHMVRELLKKGHTVTIATRGLTNDPFGTDVKRITVDRTDADSLKKLGKIHYDAVCDNLAYCSNEVKYLLESVKTDRYVMTSSVSAYEDLHDNMLESEFDPLKHELVWCNRQDFSYDEIKRQAECALFQKYSSLPSAAVRFPCIIGEDDYTKRLFFYVENTIKQVAMRIDNLTEPMAFIASDEAGRFMAWLTEQRCTGPFNAASNGSISVGEVISYVEKQSAHKAILADDGIDAPYNGFPRYYINTDKANAFGFSDLNHWIYKLIDRLIAAVYEEKER